jgi:hypothetical protein
MTPFLLPGNCDVNRDARRLRWPHQENPAIAGEDTAPSAAACYPHSKFAALLRYENMIGWKAFLIALMHQFVGIFDMSREQWRIEKRLC